MSRLPHDLIAAAKGSDITTDSVSLDQFAAQRLVNLHIDRIGQLYGQIQMPQIQLSMSGAVGGINGVGYLYQSPVMYNPSPTNPPPPIMAVHTNKISGGDEVGFLYLFSQNTPLTYSPTYSPLASEFYGISQKTRFFGFLQNLYIFQQGNNYFNGAIYPDGSIFPMGIGTPAALVETSFAAPAVKSGVVQYCQTWVDSQGFESSPSLPVSVNYGVGPSNGAVLDLGALFPASTQAVSANIYGTLGNGNQFYLLGSVTNNASNQTYHDTTADTNVDEVNVMPHFGQNDPPLPANFACVHKSRFVLPVQGSRFIQISNYNSATQFNSVGVLVDPSTGLVENPTDGIQLSVGTEQSDEVMGLCSIGSVLLIFNRLGTYILQGNDLRDFAIYPVLTARGEPVGCISPDTIARCGVGQNEVWMLARDGVYAVDGSLNINKVSQPIQKDMDTFASTVAGCASMELATSWYSQHKYHINVPVSPIVYEFDFNQTGVTRWCEKDISALLGGDTNAAVSSAFVVTPTGSPTLIVLGRTDAVTVNLWDVVTPNVLVNGMQWYGRPMQSFLPYKERAAMGEQEIRAGRKRTRRLFVFGEGTLAAGGTISMVTDGRIETYPIPPGGQYDPSQGLLLYQEFTPSMTGRVQAFLLNINGAGVFLRDTMIAYEFVS